MVQQKFSIVSRDIVNTEILSIVCDTFGINMTWILGALTENLKLGLDGKLFSVCSGFAFNGAAIKAGFHSEPDGMGEISIAVIKDGKIVPDTAKRISAKVVVCN